MTKIQFITHENGRYGYAEGARLALEGGCKWIQLRMKDVSDEEFLQVASVVQPMCKSYGATFILDDRVHLVEQCGADGVHLGRNDMPIYEARAILGNGKIIGGTANIIDDVERIWREGANYIGCGPYRFTTTKKNLSPTLGLEGYRSILSDMSLRGISLPIVAIGGILQDDVSDLMQTGIAGIAVSGAVLNADNPADEMAKFLQLTDKMV